MTDNTTYLGFQQPADQSDDYHSIGFLITKALAERQTATLVKIVAVHGGGGAAAAAGTVDVQPMVHQIDPNGTVVPHGVIHGLPYLRHGGGSDGIICDPKVGDVGICSFASRDISTVKTTRQPSGPASRRQHDWSDGMYHGQILNLAPTQWIRFSATGVEIHSPNGVTITTPNDVTIQSQTLTINANVLFNGTVVANGHVIDERHEHTGVVSGGANTGPVT